MGSANLKYGRGGIREAGQIGIAVDVEDVVQQELHVIDRGFVGGHGWFSRLGSDQDRRFALKRD